ncbi:hypothetical protein C8Q76DRAFT_734236 [Earliella scabrosa]|nr:hypothetical protein C8Q76DRAFT_734236 [Earliella scabrosa]
MERARAEQLAMRALLLALLCSNLGQSTPHVPSGAGHEPNAERARRTSASTSRHRCAKLRETRPVLGISTTADVTPWASVLAHASVRSRASRRSARVLGSAGAW